MTGTATVPGFAVLADEAAERLVDALQLEPAPLERTLAHADGTWKGAPVHIATRAWTGPRIRWARVATVTGGELEIANLLCLPRAEYPLPILGADLVALGARAGAMLAADLSPVLPPGATRDAQLAGFAARMARHALPSGGALPDWCARWFSPHALYTRPAPAQLAEAASAFRDVVDAFVALARDAGPEPALAADVARAQAGYAAAHLVDDKGLGLLGRMFGDAWASRYLRAVLFPA